MSTVISVLLGVAFLIFISYRQLRWQPVDPRRLMLIPVILIGLAVFNVVQSAGALGALQPDAIDVLSILLESAVAVIGGLVMGRLTHIERTGGGARFRLTWLGLLVWFGFIAFRIGMAALAHSTGAELAASTPLIYVMVAIVKGIQAIIVTRRVARLPEPVRVG
ncbi:hypothetical protein [Microlunatus sp. GCM10028923]|uniref:hypothetical protein n=1 Tax=Microlunatus sp. GCM10028923 TaxID=3273400 RepID=UPI00361F1194